MTIISDRQIPHHSNTRGVVVTRIQTINVDGRIFEARYWTQFETGAVHHIDSVEV